jgi:PTS system nitrogen regulatory IIA component
MHFGATLRLLRSDAGLSLRSLAQSVGVSSAYLSRVENGHDAVPTPDRLVAIARVLRLPPHVLIELGKKTSPFVAGYLERVPSANALFLEIAQRGLTSAQIARVHAFVDREFPGERSTRVGAPRFSSLLTAERIVRGMSCSHFEDVVDIAAARLAAGGSGVGAAALAEAMMEREQDAPSSVGEGVAVPHAAVPRAAPMAALVLLARPMPHATPDGLPLRMVAAVTTPELGERALPLLASAAHLAHPDVVEAVMNAADPRAILRQLVQHGV